MEQNSLPFSFVSGLAERLKTNSAERRRKKGGLLLPESKAEAREMLANVVKNLPGGKVKRELELGGAGKEDSELTLWFCSAALEGKAGKRKRQKIDGIKEGSTEVGAPLFFTSDSFTRAQHEVLSGECGGVGWESDHAKAIFMDPFASAEIILDKCLTDARGNRLKALQEALRVQLSAFCSDESLAIFAIEAASLTREMSSEVSIELLMAMRVVLQKLGLLAAGKGVAAAAATNKSSTTPLNSFLPCPRSIRPELSYPEALSVALAEYSILTGHMGLELNDSVTLTPLLLRNTLARARFAFEVSSHSSLVGSSVSCHLLARRVCLRALILLRTVGHEPNCTLSYLYYALTLRYVNYSLSQTLKYPGTNAASRCIASAEREELRAGQKALFKLPYPPGLLDIFRNAANTIEVPKYAQNMWMYFASAAANDYKHHTITMDTEGGRGSELTSCLLLRSSFKNGGGGYSDVPCDVNNDLVVTRALMTWLRACLKEGKLINIQNNILKGNMSNSNTEMVAKFGYVCFELFCPGKNKPGTSKMK